MTDKKPDPDDGYRHIDDLHEIPIPFAFEATEACVVTQVNGQGIGVKSPVGISVFLCPNCDKTHLEIQFPYNEILVDIRLEPQVAELLARMLISPRTEQP